MKTKEKLIDKIKSVLEIAIYCISLSWRSSKIYTIIRISGKIIIPFLSIGSAIIGKYIIDILSGLKGIENPKKYLIMLIGGVAILSILNIIIQRIQDYAMSMQNDILIKDISKKMMNSGSNANMEYFDNPEFYNLFTLARQDMNSVINVMWNAIDCISFTIAFLGTFLILCRINIIYSILMIVVSIPSAIANQIYVKELFKINVSQIKDQRKLNHLFDITTSKEYVNDIRLFNIGELIKDRYLNLWSSLFFHRKKTIKKYSFLVACLDILPNVIALIIILDISLNILHGTGTVGDYSLYYGILSQLTGSIYVISMSIVQIYDDKLRISNVKKFDSIKNRIENLGTQILSQVDTITFKNVEFSYPGTNKKVLENISFSINKGEKVALVGVNGAGKSTVIKLLLRFYDVDNGQILINNIDIKKYEINSLRNGFSSYFQKPTVYGFSLKENIIIGDYNTYNGDDHNILEALEESNGIDILKKMPDGIDTYLTRNFEEDGVELSLGQYQKIALARTFYRSSSVIILDEPSSSLDPEAENKVFETLDKLCQDRTTLFTSHRLSNISIADKIIVIENGNIIEQGTHKELMAEPKRYAILYKYQADKFSNA